MTAAFILIHINSVLLITFNSFFFCDLWMDGVVDGYRAVQLHGGQPLVSILCWVCGDGGLVACQSLHYYHFITHSSSMLYTLVVEGNSRR